MPASRHRPILFFATPRRRRGMNALARLPADSATVSARPRAIMRYFTRGSGDISMRGFACARRQEAPGRATSAPCKPPEALLRAPIIDFAGPED